jgi:MSHA biogenesis protein MshN
MSLINKVLLDLDQEDLRNADDEHAPWRSHIRQVDPRPAAPWRGRAVALFALLGLGFTLFWGGRIAYTAWHGLAQVAVPAPASAPWIPVPVEPATELTAMATAPDVTPTAAAPLAEAPAAPATDALATVQAPVPGTPGVAMVAALPAPPSLAQEPAAQAELPPRPRAPALPPAPPRSLAVTSPPGPLAPGSPTLRDAAVPGRFERSGEGPGPQPLPFDAETAPAAREPLLPRAAEVAVPRGQKDYEDALALLRQQRPAEAEALLRSLVVLEPQHAGARLSLSRLLATTRRDAAAAEVLADGVRRLPEHLGLRLELAQLWQRTGQSPQALALLEEGAKPAGHNPAYWLAYAQWLQRGGQPARAIEVLGRGVAQGLGDARLLLALAEAHRALGQDREALASFQQALSVPSLAPAQRQQAEAAVRQLTGAAAIR